MTHPLPAAAELVLRDGAGNLLLRVAYDLVPGRFDQQVRDAGYDLYDWVFGDWNRILPGPQYDVTITMEVKRFQVEVGDVHKDSL